MIKQIKSKWLQTLINYTCFNITMHYNVANHYRYFVYIIIKKNKKEVQEFALFTKNT